jgi:hypothetical protein
MCTERSMASPPLTPDTCRMGSILVYCRPRSDASAETLRVWLEEQASRLSAEPDVRRTAVVGVGGQSSPDTGNGWLLECELTAANGSLERLRPLLTDMRLVGLQPTVFVSEPQAV